MNNWFTLLYSVQFSHSVVFNSLRPHGLQYARPPCPSPTPGVHPNSYPSSRWCYPAISSSVVPFSSSPPSLPTSESFPMSQLFAWGGQSTGVSALASFPLKKSQGWFPSEALSKSSLTTWVIYKRKPFHSFPWAKYFNYFNCQQDKVHTPNPLIHVSIIISGCIPCHWAPCLSTLHSKGHSRIFSNTTVQKHQFFGTQLSL